MLQRLHIGVRTARVLCTLILGIGGVAQADSSHPAGSYPVDNDFKKQEDTLASRLKDCGKETKLTAQMSCKEQARKDVWKTRPARGVGYAQASYKDLPNSQLVAKWKELRDLKDKARSDEDFGPGNRRPSGELTKETLLAEMNFINSELGLRGQGIMDERDVRNRPELTEH
jgi:hypothetical protein